MNIYLNRASKSFNRNKVSIDWGITLGLLTFIVLGFFLSGCGDEHGGYQRRPHHDSADPDDGTGGGSTSGGYDPPIGGDDGNDNNPQCQKVPSKLDLRSYDCNYGEADEEFLEAEMAVGVQFEDQATFKHFLGEDFYENGEFFNGLLLEKPAPNSCGPVKFAFVSFGQPWLQISEDVEIWEFQQETVELVFAQIQNYEVQDLSTWLTEDMIDTLYEIFSCQVEGECGYNYNLPPKTVSKLGVDNEVTSQGCGLSLVLLRSYQ